MSGRRRFRTPKTVLPLLTPVCAVLAVGYPQATRPEVERTGLSERARPIAASTVRSADIRPSVGAFGEVVAQRGVESRALVPEPVVAVGENFLNGGMVRVGDLLIGLDPFEYRAALAEAPAQVAETRAELRAEEAGLAEDRILLARPSPAPTHQCFLWDGQEIAIGTDDGDDCTTSTIADRPGKDERSKVHGTQYYCP